MEVIDQSKVYKIANMLDISTEEVINAITPVDLSNITTPEQAKEAYNSAPLGSEAEHLAICKLYELVQ